MDFTKFFEKNITYFEVFDVLEVVDVVEDLALFKLEFFVFGGEVAVEEEDVGGDKREDGTFSLAVLFENVLRAEESSCFRGFAEDFCSVELETSSFSFRLGIAFSNSSKKI